MTNSHIYLSVSWQYLLFNKNFTLKHLIYDNNVQSLDLVINKIISQLALFFYIFTFSHKQKNQKIVKAIYSVCLIINNLTAVNFFNLQLKKPSKQI